MQTDFEKLISFQNLYSSMKVAIKGARNRTEISRFSLNALENILTMRRELMTREYHISSYNSFYVFEPKKRLIMSGSFRDKVLQHCLCDYVLMPKLRSVFITDNYAGQIGKGTLFGLDRLSKHLTDFYGEYGLDGYILKCDISKFYYSIKHDILKNIVEGYFEDDGIRWICDLIIDSTDGDGLPLGNQCSQVFALMYLTNLDELVTDALGFQKYGRYSDDFFIISHDKESLKRALSCIREHLNALGLSLNAKTEIVPMRKGIKFLGFHVYLTEDGRVIRKVYGSKKRAELKKVRRCAKLVMNGDMTLPKYNEIAGSIKNHLSHGDCQEVICQIDRITERMIKSNLHM